MMPFVVDYAELARSNAVHLAVGMDNIGVVARLFDCSRQVFGRVAYFERDAVGKCRLCDAIGTIRRAL